MDSTLHFLSATTQAHFEAMSLIHALGWRTTYENAVPADYMAREITDQRWVPFFKEGHRSGLYNGLILYRSSTPVACCSYGPSRVKGYEGWGEIISFYTHPQEKGQGYGGLLMEEALMRLRGDGFSKCYVLVLRENEGARRFYATHGFAWDGSHEDIPFPPDTICTDLRYTREL